MNNTYKIKGESREVGAIGIFEPFTMTVVAGSEEEARQQVRNNMYTNNREHVLIKEARMSTTLQDVKQAQPGWFGCRNKRFFGDVEYKVLHGKTTHSPFLIRLTAGWSDMFGKPKSYTYRINPLNDNLVIQPLIDQEFKTLEDVKDWLKVS